MGDDKQAKDTAKAGKKAAKAQIKALKKSGSSEDEPAATPTDASSPAPASPPTPQSPMTPAERSAAAAEQAVAINKRRLLIQVVAASLTFFAVVIALWSYLKPTGITTTTQPTGATSRPAPDLR